MILPEPRSGAVRWFDKIDKDYHIVEPGNAMYSSALMCATEYWNGVAWVEIDPEEKDA